jgi:hypothetical protein
VAAKLPDNLYQKKGMRKEGKAKGRGAIYIAFDFIASG